MRSMTSVSTYFVIATFAVRHAWAVNAVPKGNKGFGYVPSNNTAKTSTLFLDVFLDLSCPFSARAYPMMIKLAEHYGGQMDLRIFLFPLPYHRNSYMLSKGAKYIYEKTTYNVFDYFSELYSDVGVFSSSTTSQMNDNEVVAKAAAMAKSILNLDVEDFTRGVTSNRKIEELTNQEWEYACSQTSVFQTPSFMVNDQATKSIMASYDFDQWKAYLDSMI